MPDTPDPQPSPADPSAPPPPVEPRSVGKRGKVKIETKIEFDLDDADVLDIGGDGIKVAIVVVN